MTKPAMSDLIERLEASPMKLHAEAAAALRAAAEREAALVHDLTQAMDGRNSEMEARLAAEAREARLVEALGNMLEIASRNEQGQVIEDARAVYAAAKGENNDAG